MFAYVGNRFERRVACPTMRRVRVTPVTHRIGETERARVSCEGTARGVIPLGKLVYGIIVKILVAVNNQKNRECCYEVLLTCDSTCS